MTIPFLSGRRRRRHSHPTRRPDGVPDAVLFADEQVRALAGVGHAGYVLVGLAGGGDPVYLDLDDTDSNVAVYTGAGGGGSSILRSLTAQAVHGGATATVIDTSRHQRWARGLPGIDYLTDIAAVHDRLVALANDARTRSWAIDDHGQVRRRVVVLDNATSTLYQLRRWWDGNRPDLGAPRRSPALTAFEDLLFMGRAARISLLLHAPSIVPSSLLGAEARANLTTPILARVTDQTWRQATGRPLPPPRRYRPGRVHITWPEQDVETQALYMTEPEARHHAAPTPPASLPDSGAIALDGVPFYWAADHEVDPPTHS